jgi:hypothetical protein
MCSWRVKGKTGSGLLGGLYEEVLRDADGGM